VVQRRPNESIDNLLRRFRRSSQDVQAERKKRRWFVSKSEKERAKKKRGRKRWRLKRRWIQRRIRRES